MVKERRAKLGKNVAILKPSNARRSDLLQTRQISPAHRENFAWVMF